MSLILGKVVKTDPYDHLPFTIGNTFLVSSWLTTLFAVVAGTLLFTSEVQHGTLAGALTARPSKPIIVGAKALIAAVLGFAMGALGIVGGLVGGVASGMDTGDMSGAVPGVAWALVLTTLASVLGLGVGLIVRHSAAAVTTCSSGRSPSRRWCGASFPPPSPGCCPSPPPTACSAPAPPPTRPRPWRPPCRTSATQPSSACWAAVTVAIGTALLMRQDS